MARFGIVGNVLYTLTGDKIRLFDISVSSNPSEKSTILLGTGVETIFPYQDKLFFGSTTGMLIYDNTDPFAPKYLSRYNHIMSCDPVAVDGNYAYVTLRSGTRCHNYVNTLDIVDLSDLSNPKLAHSYSMTNPHGLGIDNHTLFLCDGNAGLKIYDVSSPLTLVVKAEYKNINTFDVIPNNRTLVMVGDSGIYQYDYSNLNSITLESQIKVKP